VRIIFVDDIAWDYTIDSAYGRPLGGSQSALCYLAEELARQGHAVALVNNTTTPGQSRGVEMWSLAGDWAAAFRPPPDAVVVLNSTDWGVRLRPLVGRQARIVLWLSLAHDQEMLFGLRDQAVRAAHDAYAFLSDWQADAFHRAFGTELERSAVLRYGVGPRFAGLFGDDEPILATKARPPVLAYCSAPFRGLHVLAYYAFPRIRAFVPQARLRIFSSMKIYPYTDGDQDDTFAELYRACRETAGIEYVGAVPQPQLADELKSAAMLAYPCTWPETACLAVMEAMAAGCHVVSSDFAVLPETAAGFAHLVPYHDDVDIRAYANAFVNAAVAVLERWDEPDSEAHLRAQVEHMNRTSTWPVRAREWSAWLEAPWTRGG
jgi:glycosyltransferase involved in cell wall biosynthesis